MSHRFRFFVRLVVGSVLIVTLQGCAEVGYYYQSARGHFGIMASSEPIDDLLREEALEETRREQLEQAQAIRRYASEHLGLPDNDSYTEFAELGRPFAVWSVVATDPFSMVPKEWCFPVVGCVTYRGYFQQQAAQALADELAEQSLDVYVGGVQAYSTLGWFDDPIVSSMLDRGDILLAEVVFHELAHQRLYFKNDTDFNEAFATLVGEYGVRQWLSDTNPEALPRYEQWLAQKEAFITLLQDTSDDLKVLYLTEPDEAKKAEGKAGIFAQMKRRYDDMKADWGGTLPYDKWFEKPVNNARLATVATYRDLVPDFARWFSACGSEFEPFYNAMLSFKELEGDERQRALEAEATCSPSG